MLSQISDIAVQIPFNQGYSLTTLSTALSIPLTTASEFQALASWTPEGPITSGSELQERAEYVARRLAAQPLALAQLGQTAFIHHTQVGASEILQEALAACALYAMRNAINADLIRSEIKKYSARLIRSLLASLNADTPQYLDHRMHLLSSLQALLIYQCIRLFGDLDTNQRTQAEQDEAILRSLVSALLPSTTSLSETGDWCHWVQEESLRRAIITAELVIGVYTFLKQGWDQAEARLLRLDFTAQVALWEARSPMEWETLWLRRPRFEVRLSHWAEDMGMCLPEDLDELGVLIRASFFGLEALKGWPGWRQDALIN